MRNILEEELEHLEDSLAFSHQGISSFLYPKKLSIIHMIITPRGNGLFETKKEIRGRKSRKEFLFLKSPAVRSTVWREPEAC